MLPWPSCTHLLQPPHNQRDFDVLMAFQGKSGFKVIVVGGSVAGLSLAHALEKANIDYVILEGRDSIAPQLGASIILSANGSRILDQLGVYEPLGDIKTPLHRATNWKGSGERISQNDGGKLVEAR
jgi:2-polyprenyl-6-methoxyphenol hydroxylase-like FAD-dependent oxidoreductase